MGGCKEFCVYGLYIYSRIRRDVWQRVASILNCWISCWRGETPRSCLNRTGLLDELKKALAERVLNAEIDHHLGQGSEQASGNRRNGTSSKTVLTDTGKLELSIPRDRQSRFEPQLIAKYQRRFPGFDEKIIALYARGLSTRDIQAHLRELYGTEISPELVSAVTDSVLDEVTLWQNRPLEAVYSIVFFDALRVKIRDEGTVKNKAVYLAIGMRCSGHKEVLGLWIEQTEGAKFWLRVMTEIRNRGTQDILIAVVDGLKGFPEAITAVFPQTLVQTCIVHLIRYSMEFASWKERRAIVGALKPIYRAESAEAARQRLEEFDAGPLGAEVSGRRPELEAELGAGHSIFRIRPRSTQNCLYDQWPSRAYTVRSGRRCAAVGISPVTRRRPSSSGWSCAT